MDIPQKPQFDLNDNLEIKIIKTINAVSEIIDYLESQSRIYSHATPPEEKKVPSIMSVADCQHINTKITKRGTRFCMDCNRFVK